MSCNDEQRQRPEVTIVTTLQVTHVLRDCTAEEAQGLAAVIARTAAEALEGGYREGVLPQGQPDNIAVGSVQIFSMDARGEEHAEGSAE